MSGKPAARLSDPTACPIPGHGTNPIAAGSPDVLFDSLPAARMGDASACGGALASAVIPTVLINGKPATTIGTVGSHGNVVVAGSGTVIIGTSGGGAVFTAPLPLLTKGFDICIQLLDQASGAPMKNMAYTATLEDGSEVHGTTDTNGLTRLLGKKDVPQAVALSVKPGWVLRGE
ncbi:PAAR domain-containing protein [Pseudomonas sp. sp1636]|uniref:PAAR domain-containing protein n=1 Tax=Pseudomonas sp. sp1636 TaxID=3036707 RepID=UPI0025A4F6F7|nr:PAAR domain-containing protein [Pseudomonas sp. sp1636]MDM8348558.1 PAAR domain-containing protein [Pseudomonas sp. sp1636]